MLQYGTSLAMTTDPREAVHRADVVVTDTWVSMGQEEEKAQRMKDFAGFQVTRKVRNKGWRQDLMQTKT